MAFHGKQICTVKHPLNNGNWGLVDWEQAYTKRVTCRLWRNCQPEKYESKLKLATQFSVSIVLLVLQAKSHSNFPSKFRYSNSLVHGVNFNTNASTKHISQLHENLQRIGRDQDILKPSQIYNKRDIPWKIRTRNNIVDDPWGTQYSTAGLEFKTKSAMVVD